MEQSQQREPRGAYYWSAQQAITRIGLEPTDHKLFHTMIIEAEWKPVEHLFEWTGLITELAALTTLNLKTLPESLERLSVLGLIEIKEQGSRQPWRIVLRLHRCIELAPEGKRLPKPYPQNFKTTKAKEREKKPKIRDCTTCVHPECPKRTCPHPQCPMKVTSSFEVSDVDDGCDGELDADAPSYPNY